MEKDPNKTKEKQPGACLKNLHGIVFLRAVATARVAPPPIFKIIRNPVGGANSHFAKR